MAVVGTSESKNSKLK